MNYEIKTASLSQIFQMLEMAAEEGWNPGLDDAFSFQQIDPNGFFVGLLNNQLISCISNVKYSSDYSFLGLYIVKEAYRGKGFGKKIWDHAIQYSNQNIGLDGVVEQQENYKKSGFRLAFQNERYCLEHNNLSLPKSILISAKTIPVSQIIAYDNEIISHQRQSFLISWLYANHSNSIVFLDGNKTRGYGVIRKCRIGYKIGPLFADRFEIAEQLFLSLCISVEKNAPIFLDIIEANLSAKKLVDKYKLSKVFATARMYTQHIPIQSIERIYGLTTFEVG